MSEIEPSRAEPVESGPSQEVAPPLRLLPRVPDHELLRLIGRGAYGEVWLARSITGEFRAVKVVYRRNFDHDRPYEREFAGIKKFEPISRSHESQVDILHIGRNEADGYFYYVMELAGDANAGGPISLSAAGGTSALPSPDPGAYVPKTFKSVLQHCGRLPAAECVKLGLSLTTALDHLHRNSLVHRDVKPSNIIFINGRPMLADIGLVTTLDATRSLVGTLGFAPPEGPGTAVADLYSLGKVLYEAATGRDRQEFPELPTQLGGSPQEEVELLELNQVILKACDHDPNRRYPSSAAMRADLAFLEGGKSLRRKRVVQRRLALLVKGGALLLALGTGGVLLVHQSRVRYERRGSIQLPASPAPSHAESKIPDAALQFESIESAIRSRADRYPRLTPATEVGKHTFIPFKLNVHPLRWGDEYFDAVRFTTPADSGLDMVVACTCYNRKVRYGLLPVQGTMEREFQRRCQWPAARYEGVRAPAADGQELFAHTPAQIQMLAAVGATNETMRRKLEATAPGIQVVLMTALSGKFLDPSRDYLLLFTFFREQPAQFEIAMNFVPPGVSSETNCASLEDALGLVVRSNQAAEQGNPGRGVGTVSPFLK